MTLRNIPTATYAHNALSCIQWRTIGAGHEKGKNKLQIRNSTAKFLIFTRQASEDGIEVRVAEETVWLTQKLIGVLFDKGHSTITEHLKNSEGLVFTADNGLTVAETEELRSKLRQEQSSLQVIKKTLLRKAISEAKLELEDFNTTGNVGLAFSQSDPVAPARLVNNVAKVNEKFQILGGLLEGKFISKEKVIELAKLPSRQELLAKVVGTINAPVSGFVNVLAGNIRNLVNVLNAVKDKK